MKATYVSTVLNEQTTDLKHLENNIKVHHILLRIW